VKHRSKVIPLAIVGVLGIFMVIFSATQLGGSPSDITGQVIANACEDTDGGSDYLVKGDTSGLNGPPFSMSTKYVERTDECSLESEYVLIEYYCLDDIVASQSVNCELIDESQEGDIYTCEDGACVIVGGGAEPDPTKPEFEWDELTPTGYMVGDASLGASFAIFADPGKGSLTLKWADIISAAPPIGLVYKYINVDTTLTSYDLASEPTIYFEVLDNWMLDNFVAASQIELQRLSYGEWTPLLTTEVSTLQQTSLTGTYFTAATPGFSYFAITVPVYEINDTPLVLDGPECGDGIVDYSEDCEEGDDLTCADYLGNPSCTGLVTCSYCNWDSYDCYCACDTTTQPQPGEWLECEEGEQVRSIYSCDTTSGEWEASEETQECSGSNLMWILIIAGTILVVGGIVFALFFYFRAKSGPAVAPVVKPALKPAKPQL